MSLWMFPTRAYRIHNNIETFNSLYFMPAAPKQSLFYISHAHAAFTNAISGGSSGSFRAILFHFWAILQIMFPTPAVLAASRINVLLAVPCLRTMISVVFLRAAISTTYIHSYAAFTNAISDSSLWI